MNKNHRWSSAAAAVLFIAAGSLQAQIFFTDTDISLTNTNYDNQDIVVFGCTVTIDGPHTFSDVLVAGGGELTHSLASNDQIGVNIPGGLNLTVQNNFVVDAGSIVTANGLNIGFSALGGAGRSVVTNIIVGGPDYSSGSGGGHGGAGGNSLGGAPGGAAYGTPLVITNSEMGSSGGAGYGPGGLGGGSVRLHVGGVALVDGTIMANGGDATNNSAGGGSGGSVFIAAEALAGGGTILARGGTGALDAGGGGGGGRILIDCQTNGFSGSLSTAGGPGVADGGAGTICLTNGPTSTLLVDNGGLPGAITPLTGAAFGNLTIAAGAAGLFSAQTETVSNLLIAAGGELIVTNPQTHSQNQASALTVPGSAEIDAGGSLVVDFINASSSYAIGAGATISRSDVTTGGGGGNAGNGGISAGGAAGGIMPGMDLYLPSAGGMGGAGNGTGGLGGGLLNLVVGKNLTVNGLISANGAAGVAQGSGGGAGGGISITAPLLVGTGTFAANGGAGHAFGGGGGGGGDIALDVISNQFTGRLAADGGAGFQAGGAGTIYLWGSSSQFAPRPKLILDNGGLAGAAVTSLSQFPYFNGDLFIGHGAVLTPHYGFGFNVHSLVIASNGMLRAASNQISSVTIEVSDSARIDSGGSIDLDGSGDAANNGPYPGHSYVGNNTSSGSGAGNGGYGGANLYGIGGGGASGEPYFENVQAGSGGGGPAGGTGGGALSLTVNSNLEINGVITANGLSSSTLSGGGAGGTILLNARMLSGDGIITANGGAGGLPLGGGGGGGQIMISVTTNLFTGTTTAYGGAGAMYGGAGLILTGAKSILGDSNQVVLDNDGHLGTNTPLTTLNALQDLTVANGAILAAASQAWLHSLLITSNAYVVSLRQEPMAWNFTGSANIEPGGGIVFDGASPVRTQPDAGRNSDFNGVTTGSGGGHGGYGGASAGGAIGGASYDQVNLPQVMGASGGIGLGSPGLGGAGGGAIQIISTTGTLNLGGIISANGLSGPSPGSGGGSGGAILLSVQTLTGNGVISANGGSGNLPLGGGGGGGRIAIMVASNSFAGTYSAHGGAGFHAGGAGTTWLGATTKSPTAGFPQLIIDNGGQIGTNTTLQNFNFNSANLTVTGGASLAVGAGVVPTFHNLFIGSNSFLRPLPNADQAAVFNFAASTLTIQAGGGLDFDAANLSSQPGVFQTGAIHCGPGGGNGGYGGASGAGLSGGPVAGTIATPESPGGTSGYNALPGIFSPGGAAVRLMVSGLSTINGSITVNGASATNGQAGGGAGGSIYLTTQGLAGNGLLSANGGAGQLPDGGGGGGGRIAVYSTSNSFSGRLSATGGNGFMPGGAGTIYQQTNTANFFLLTLDNGGLIGTNTPLGESFGDAPSGADLHITRGAVAVAPPLASNAIQAGLTLHSLLIDSNAVLTQSSKSFGLRLIISSNATVAATSAISVDGQGYPGAEGPGAGLWNADAGSGGGGSYGGAGGDSIFGGKGGLAYGSSNAPIDLGSGGGLPGAAPGFSDGGGIVELQVSRTLTVDGAITANGQPAEYPGAGGGAGGSVWLAATTLAGTGAISANGGAGDPGAGGGGGGGRLAVYFLTNTFTGSLSVAGGSGNAPGSSGTLVLSTNNSPSPLIVEPAELRGDMEAVAGSLTLHWAGAAELVYQVQCSTNLIDWVPCGPPVIGSNGAMTVSAQPSGPAQFFRIISRN